MLVDYLNELTIAQCKDLFRLYLKIEDLSNTNEIQPNKIKRPKDLIYEMYKNICMYKEILDFWLKRYPDFGRTVSVLKNGKQIDGKIVNLNLNGELLLDVGGKIEIVNSGEIFA